MKASSKSSLFYIIHGDCDTTVPINKSINMLTAINKSGGHAQMKILYGVNHDAWVAAYADDSLTDWLLSQNRMNNV